MAAPRFLVLRGGALGDFVLTLPVFQALRARWPDARVEAATYPRHGRLALAGGAIDAWHSLEQPDFARLFAPGAEFSGWFMDLVPSFDVIVNLLYDPDDLIVPNLRSLDARQVLALDPRPRERHAADHLASVLHALALYPEPAEPRLVFQAAPPAGPAPVILHPGSGSPVKNWAWPRFLELARRLAAHGLPVAFCAGEVEAEQMPELADCPYPVHRFPAVEDLAPVLASARLFIGNDSGVSHLAAASGVPVIALFGPTRADLWAPRGRGGVTVLRGGPLMRDLAVEPVWEAVRRVLG